MRNAKIRFALLLLALFALLALKPAGADEAAPFSDDPKAIQEASKSVVMLSCYDKDGWLTATGSAFAAFEDGVFVTNFHVIEEGTYSVRAKMETEQEFRLLKVVAYDADKDLAILRTEEETGIVPLALGASSALERGEKVIAIGSPLGLLNTLSIGLYSGTTIDEQVYLQFSAPISHGSSGGALFNNRGEVVGVTSASFTEGQNLNLAIPIEDVVALWDGRGSRAEAALTEYYQVWNDGASDDGPLEFTWDEVRGLLDEEDGDFYTFDEVAVIVWIPAGLEPLDLSDEDIQNGYIGYFADEDEEYVIAVQKVYTGMQSLDEYKAALMQLDSVTECEDCIINDLEALLYLQEENDSFSVAFITDAANILEFTFWPCSDEDYRAVASVVLSSIQAEE